MKTEATDNDERALKKAARGAGGLGIAYEADVKALVVA